jgi:lipopolysaccharide transport system ATP-binding protein
VDTPAAVPAIRVEGLGKEYLIGASQRSQETFREMLAGTLTAPFRRLRGARPQAERFWALRDVTFDIPAGEVVGVVGRNGAGKSTLLKILARITEPTTGRVRIRGRVSSLLEVGTGFHPELTGRENIYLNGAILGMTRAEIRRKFDEIVAFAEIDRFLDTPVKHYSSGMYVRLAFAVAAHLEPDILLVDEVLAVGDAAFQKKCMGRMSEVAHDGRTVILVSHNLGAIQAMCRSALYLEQGRIKGVGTAGEVSRAFAADMQALGPPSPGRELGVDVTLAALSVGAGYVHARAGAPFHIELVARSPTTLHDLSLMFFSGVGERIGLIDCRPWGLPRTVAAGDVIRVRGHVKSMHLVEGDYRLGLYVRSSAIAKTFDSLGSVVIGPGDATSGFVPYPSGVRGFVEFEASAQLEVGR